LAALGLVRLRPQTSDNSRCRAPEITPGRHMPGAAHALAVSEYSPSRSTVYSITRRLLRHVRLRIFLPGA
jgi:hypothetical protein